VLFLQFKYVYDKKALLTVDYIRNLYPYVILYEDDEDQRVQPEPEPEPIILNYKHKDEPSPDDQVYCEQFTDSIPNDGNVEPPLRDLYALRMFRFLIAECLVAWGTGTATFTRGLGTTVGETCVSR
jgi:hypothetical protein